MEISIDFSDVEKQVADITRKAPWVIDEIIIHWLLAGAKEILHRSVIGASGIRGVTGKYHGAFTNTDIMGGVGDRHIIVVNVADYSMVIEHGAKFTNKMPPPGVLDEWVRKIIAPGSIEEVKRIAYLIGRSYVRKGRAGKKAIKGRYVMTNAYKKAKARLDTWLKQLVDQGLKKL